MSAIDKQIISIPTGHIIVDGYSNGLLETLSIGDYGKSKNVKADFLGYTRELNGVPNGDIMPLSEKWVITISTQYGCPMNCQFCDVPKVGYKGNASLNDMRAQIINAIRLHPEVRYTERLNIHYARMGEPIFNPAVLELAEWMYKDKAIFFDGVRIEVVHPVLTTMLPRGYKHTESTLQTWCEIKNDIYNGQAGLQLSINSTSETIRDAMFDKRQEKLENIANICKNLPSPKGRKYCLNFALDSNSEINGAKLVGLFDPEKFMCKITPIHNCVACRRNGIKTIEGYNSYTPYRTVEEELKLAGFDVLVFIPSFDEEDGCITCGNAILGGSIINIKQENSNESCTTNGILI